FCKTWIWLAFVSLWLFERDRFIIAKENPISRRVTFHASYSTIVTRAAIALLMNVEAQNLTPISLILCEVVGFYYGTRDMIDRSIKLSISQKFI
ncbi:hypothetical protein, partial [Microcystis aeruginosa]|uniref:hypothetical protein n=1 Tax=Microcystis aeruginosa TaxID=1126 RepID=UPI001C115F2C